jgi:hypothetical protein
LILALTLLVTGIGLIFYGIYVSAIGFLIAYTMVTVGWKLEALEREVKRLADHVNDLTEGNEE